MSVKCDPPHPQLVPLHSIQTLKYDTLKIIVRKVLHNKQKS